nr:ATP synthase F0 subunit 8 [Ophidiomyces ophidiicola]WML69488.1 ATP synthase F0 subunit 8 [Ophidiomyces ophidiicola]
MPQLVPFFFVNQTLFTLFILSLLFIFFSGIVLPWFLRIFVSRLFINKL